MFSIPAECLFEQHRKDRKFKFENSGLQKRIQLNSLDYESIRVNYAHGPNKR